MLKEFVLISFIKPDVRKTLNKIISANAVVYLQMEDWALWHQEKVPANKYGSTHSKLYRNDLNLKLIAAAWRPAMQTNKLHVAANLF